MDDDQNIYTMCNGEKKKLVNGGSHLSLYVVHKRSHFFNYPRIILYKSNDMASHNAISLDTEPNDKQGRNGLSH